MSLAQAAGPVDQDIQVNAYTGGDQQAVHAASRSDGSFVVVWDSEGSFGSDDSSYSVQAQILDAEGGPLGGEFQVNAETYFFQYNASVAVRPDRSFVIVWDHLAGPGPDPADFDVRGRVFDSSGGALGVEFTVNAYTERDQSGARVVALEDSSFVVAWTGWWDGSYTGIHARRFFADATPASDPVVVNEYIASQQRAVDFARLSHGGFVVAWHSYRQLNPGFRFETVVRELTSDLTPTTSDVMASGPESGVFAAVVPRTAGRYQVFWHEGAPRPIQGRRFATGGLALSGAFDANEFSETNLSGTRLAPGPNGEFAAVWQAGAFSVPGVSPDGDVYAIVARFFGDGLPIGDEFVVNSYTTEAQVAPAVAYAPDGRALVVWQSRGGFGDDTDGYSIQARFLESPAIFFDGFEEGSTAAWDTAVSGR